MVVKSGVRVRVRVLVFVRVFVRVFDCMCVCVCAHVCAFLFCALLAGYHFSHDVKRQVNLFNCALVKMCGTSDIMMLCKFFK